MLFTMHITLDDQNIHKGIEVNKNGWTRKKMIGRTEKTQQ